MGGDEGSSGGRRFFKAVFVALVLCIFMSQLFIDNLTSTETKGGTAAAITSVGSLRQVMFIGRKKHSVSGNSDLIAASKRRVPNGPDPIHNRYLSHSFQHLCVCLPQEEFAMALFPKKAFLLNASQRDGERLQVCLPQEYLNTYFGISRNCIL